MDTLYAEYIVVTLPERGDELVLLSSTWLTGEFSDQGHSITQMPSVDPNRFYETVQQHRLCTPEDKKYCFDEICRPS